MTVLLDPLPPDQQRLVEVIYGPFNRDGTWPLFQYVDAVLDQEDLEATPLLSTLPSVGMSHRHYGLVWHNQHGIPRPETKISLTVAGLAHCQDANEHLRLFFHTLGFLIERYRSFIPSPITPQDVEVHSKDLAQSLQDAGFVVLPDVTLPMLDELMEHEPPTSGLSRRRNDDGSRDWQVHSYIRRFRGITTVEAYLARVDELIGVRPASPPPIAPSPLSLPLAIDFLDTVWRVWNGKDHLFTRRDAATDAQLALDCTTFDEFNARLSALAIVLKTLNVPPMEDPARQATAKLGPLEQLARFLLEELRESAAQERVARAVDELKCINRIRVGGQHGGKKPSTQAVQAFQELGISFPPTDWGSAWDSVRTRAVEALSAIREEIQAIT